MTTAAQINLLSACVLAANVLLLACNIYDRNQLRRELKRTLQMSRELAATLHTTPTGGDHAT